MESLSAGKIKRQYLTVGREEILTIIVLLTMVICGVFHEIYASSFISILSYFYLLTVFFRNRIIIFPKYLWYFWTSATAIIGCFLLESKSLYLYEIVQNSSYSGATTYIVFFYSLFLIATRYFDQYYENKFNKRSENNRKIKVVDFFNQGRKINTVALIGCLAGIVVASIAFMYVARNPSFIHGLDRFRYSEEFDYGGIYKLAVRLSRYLMIPCIVVAVYYKKKLAWVAIALYLMHSVWTGNKFTALLMLFWWLAIIYSKKLVNKETALKKFAAIIGIIVVLLGGFAVFSHSLYRNANQEGYVVQRLAQQGQLWWGTFNKTTDWHVSELSDELSGIVEGHNSIEDNVGSNYGIYKIMYLNAPRSTVDNKLASGSRYTEAGYATAYYYLGNAGGIILACVGGIVSSFLVNLFIYYLRFNQYIRAFITLRLIDHLTTGMLLFDWVRFLNTTAIASYVILLVFRKKLVRFGQYQI